MQSARQPWLLHLPLTSERLFPRLQEFRLEKKFTIIRLEISLKRTQEFMQIWEIPRIGYTSCVLRRQPAASSSPGAPGEDRLSAIKCHHTGSDPVFSKFLGMSQTTHRTTWSQNTGYFKRYSNRSRAFSSPFPYIHLWPPSKLHSFLMH